MEKEQAQAPEAVDVAKKREPWLKRWKQKFDKWRKALPDCWRRWRTDRIWEFDRVFGDSRRVISQAVFILVLVAVLVGFITLVGWLLTLMGLHKVNDHDSLPLIQSIGLAFGTTNLPGGVEYNGVYEVFPLWWQAIAALLSAVLFGGVTITFVGNLLSNRQEAYRNGTVRYWFDRHVLFLGGGEMVGTMLKEKWKKEWEQTPDKHTPHVVVLTERDAAEVRMELVSQLSEKERKKIRLTVLRGRRDDKDELLSVGVDRADMIYIVGEEPLSDDYDSVNIDAYQVAGKIYQKAREQGKVRPRVPCYLQLERAASEHIFRHDTKPFDPCFETTIVNRLEAVAQRILVHNSDSDSDYPPLDRGGIGPDSERTVHLVLYGMTAFSYAMATTAAHLCHFPNFVSVTERDGQKHYEERPDRRTRITFIAPNIAEEMNYMTAHLSSLFAMSKVTVDGVTTTPDEDFLDIEWEFVDGNIADPAIRQKLEQYYRDNEEGRTYLTLALCQREARHNMAAALYMPDCYHRIHYKDGTDKPEVDYERTVPIFVYQPGNEVQLQRAHDNVPMYCNIFPVGSLEQSYDPSIRQRIKEGKRIHYIYAKSKTYQGMTQSQAELDELWNGLIYTDQKSNIYCANQVGVKLRSMGLDVEALCGGKGMDEDTIALLAVVEHNRWDVEKLLMGYGVVDRKERHALKQLELDGKAAERDALKAKLKGQRNATFCHECIAPYEKLIECEKSFDISIVEHLPDAIERVQKEEQKQ